LKVEEKERKALNSSFATRAMSSRILLLNKDLDEREALQPLCRKIGIVQMAMSPAEAAILATHRDLDILVADVSLADYAGLSAILTPKTSVLITGLEERAADDIIHTWPADYYVDFSPLPADEKDALRFSRALDRAAEHARLKAKLEELTAQKASPERIREVYLEIKEIKNFINDNVVRELEKRVALQVRYLWFQRRKQKIEDILRKIYMADDVSSLLDTVSDIKSLVQASGISFYILDENETLGKYLKPLVWDDAFLSHHEFSKYIVLLDSPDFAAQAVRHREDVNITDFSLDKRLAKRYVEHLKNPLRSLLCVPIMHGKDVIGVLEVYNKLHKGELSKYGFSREDQQVLRGISEHISLAMTKLNLIQYDALTGLLRPDPFFEKVIQKINQQSKRRQEIGSYAMVMGDVDWFKNYNDLHGGEEFLFFLTGVNSLEEACLLTDRIRKNIEEFYFENEESQPRQNLTMSFGVTLLPRKEDFYTAINRYELKKVANEADMALAEAKGKRLYSAVGTEAAEAAGPAEVKNKVCAFQPGRDSIDREKKGTVIKPYRQEYFEERRKSRRHYVSTLLLYQENGNFKVTKTVNLSTGGVRIISDTQLLTDKTLDLFLILENKATPFKGDIVYSEKPRQEAVHYHSGIQFREMGVAQRKALENYLASVPGREASA
jgi:GGDEF domain-containing protein